MRTVTGADGAIPAGGTRTCRCLVDKPCLRFNPTTGQPLWLCDSHAAQMDKGQVFEVVSIDASPQATVNELQHEAVRTLWRIGDAWRNFLREISESPGTIWAVTAGGSVRVLNVREGWQLRVPAPGGAVVVGDRKELPLSEVSVATPCGITTWGNGPTTWSSSTAVLLLATGLPDDRPAVRTGLSDADVRRSFAAHPEGTCGALHCHRVAVP